MVPPPAGIIIAASVLVAAGIAAYEHPQVREWLDKSREKIALAFHSIGEDRRAPQPRRDDRSMREDDDEKAAERRRQARQEILERARILEERNKQRKSSAEPRSPTLNEKRSPSFDTLVDEDGKLRSDVNVTEASSSAVEPQDANSVLRSRHTEQQQQLLSSPKLAVQESVDAPMSFRQFDAPTAPAVEPWESQYEREMRHTWNIPLPERRTPTASTHASESLIDLTPTTEDFPDPDVSIPSVSDLEHPLERTEYFSMPPSRSSHTWSGSEADSETYPASLSESLEALEPRPLSNIQDAAASAPSRTRQTTDQRHLDHLDDLESDDSFSELGDGVRTPASAWTEVGSTVSEPHA